MSRRKPKTVSFEEYQVYSQPPPSEPEYTLVESYPRESFANYLLKKHPYIPPLVFMLVGWASFQVIGMYPYAYLLEIVMIPFLPIMMRRAFGIFGMLTSVILLGAGMAFDDFLIRVDPVQRQVVNGLMILAFLIGFLISVVDHAGKSHRNN